MCSSASTPLLRRVLAATTLAGCLLLPGPISGQGPVPLGDEFQVNTYTTLFQRAPAVSLDSLGNFVVVWESNGSAGDDTGLSIQGQRFDSTGTAVGGEFQVNTFITGNQDEPSVGTDGSGNFVVVWASDGSPGDDDSSLSIQGQRFDSAGVAVGAQFQANSSTDGLQANPDIAVHPDGSFTVVWESTVGSGTDTTGFSIEGRRFDTSGDPVGDQFQINAYTTNEQRHPAIAGDTAGNFVVVWWSVGSGGDDDSFNSIQGQRYDSLGTPLGGEFQVNTYITGPQTAPVVAMHSTGKFVVAWRSEGSSGSDNDGSSIQAQRFASTGAPAGSEFQVNTITSENQGGPAIAMNGDGDFVVIWYSSHDDASDLVVQGQLFDDLGAPVGNEFAVNTSAYIQQFNGFRGVGMNNDGFVAAWTSYGSTGSDNESHSVQGRRFGPPDLEAPPAPTVGVSPNPVLIDTVATLDVTASDATTGDIPIASIEYQIDGGDWFEMQPKDGDWDESTEQAEELLTFEEGGTFSICARAFDLASNESEPGCTDVEAIVPEPDLRLRAIEVNQAIQNWRNEIPLYQEKKTVVRVFFEKTDASSPSSADGLLHGSIGGVPLPGSPLVAPAPATVGNDASAFAVVDGPDADSDPDDQIVSFRGKLSNSLNYLLPANWINQGGTVDLDFELTTPTDQVLECAEPDGDANCSVSVQFEAIDRPVIEFFSAPYHRNERRQILVNATGGTYEFVSGGDRSDPVPWDAGLDEIEDAVEDVLNSRDGRVRVAGFRSCGSPAAGVYTSITILRGQSEDLEIDDSGLAGSATMQLCEAGGPMLAPTHDHLREQVRRITDVFPTSGVDFRLRDMGHFKRAPTLLKVNTRLSKIRAADRILGNFAPKSFALLLELGPTSTKTGMAWLAVSSTYANYREDPTDGGQSRSTGGHEAAHTYGRAHAVVADQGALGSVGLCGSEYLDQASPLHPFVEETGVENELAGDIDESIRFTWPTIGPLSSGPDDEIWGFSPRAYANGPGFEHLVVVDPRMSAELMSYCDPPGTQQDRWISSFSYEKLANRVRGASRDAPGRGAAATQEFFLIAGSIDEVTGEVEMEPITRLSGNDPGFDAGDVRVALVDEFGNEFSLRHVALLRDGDHASLSDGVGPEPSAFVAAVPSFGEFFEPHGVVVTFEDEEIARITASSNPPTVAITSPTSRSTATDVVPIAWSADDLDGDPLTTTILYSLDSGTTWKTLANDLEGNSYDARTEYLEGSDTALIKLLVSDGFHTAEATSDLFEIDAGFPTASIEVPADQIAVDGLLQLRGDAWDPGDGELEGSALTWTMTAIADPAGLQRGVLLLGEGRALDLPTSGYPTGCHLITLTATDSEGKTAVDTIGVDLGATRCFGGLFADGFENGNLDEWSNSVP